MNHYEFKELKDGESFDPNTLVPGIPFTQQAFYGDWQKSSGRTVRRFVVHDGTIPVAYFQLIVYPLMKGKNYIYVPYGPVTTDTSPEFFAELKSKLNDLAQEHQTAFVRLAFTPSLSVEKTGPYFKRAPFFTYHSAYFQPRSDWYLGLSYSEDTLLAAMHEKTRYSVRLAERKGIKTDIVTDNFDAYYANFYTLMKETADRNGFRLHPEDYFKAVFKSLPQIKNSYLSVATYEGKVLAIDLVIVSGNIANYVFGGSSTEERNRMPTYIAQWKAIQYAKTIGCTDYNFGAVSAEGDRYKGWDGLSSFKKKFGGYEVKHSDFMDVVTKPFWYHAYVLRKYLKTFGI